MSAQTMLTVTFWMGLAFDAAAGFALWYGKPWQVVLVLVIFGGLCHPGAQPTLRKMVEQERAAIAIEARRAATTGAVHESAGRRHRQDTNNPTNTVT